MILRHYGIHLSYEKIRALCRMDRQGSSLGALAHALEHLGFKTLAVKVTFAEMYEKAILPCVAFWTQGHYVVVERVTERAVYLLDPSIGYVKFLRREWDHAWLAEGGHDYGILLLVEPTNTKPLLQTSTPKISFATLIRPLWKTVRRDIYILLGATLSSVLAQLALPFLSAGVIDLGIQSHSPTIVLTLCVAQAVLVAARLLAEIVQSWILAYVGARCNLSLMSDFLLKVTELPLSFFDGKTAADLMQRIADQKSIEQFFTDSLGQITVAFLSLVVFGTVLAAFNLRLLGVFTLGTLFYTWYSVSFFRRQRILNYKAFRLSARKQGIIMEVLSGMQEIKLNNAERTYRWTWERAQHDIGRTEVALRVTTVVQTSGGGLITQVMMIILTLLTAGDVIKGTMTLGTMIAVQFIIGQLSVPVNQIMSLLAQGQNAMLSHVRNEEVKGLRDERYGRTILQPDLSGDIVLTDVSFRYGGSNNRPVLNNISVRIPQGNTTAIVGVSGSGKTTLMKLLLQFYEPTTGVISVGGKLLSEIDPPGWRRLCGVVTQDGMLFSDSIAANIALGCEEIDMAKVERVAEVAQISGFIDGLPRKYSTRVGRSGIGISKGQAQRLMIARALYREPAYVLFDEATSALDSATETALVSALQAHLRNSTVVVIAHRLSTVRHANQIVVLDDGSMSEFGSHEELIRKRGAYWHLIRNQLELGE